MGLFQFLLYNNLTNVYSCIFSATCLPLGTYRGYQYTGAYSSDIGTVLGVSCRTGYTSKDSINSITCQANGAWTPLPVCSGGQVLVKLQPPSIGPAPVSHTVNYLNGSSTAQVGLGYLPQCRATGRDAGGSGQYLRLTNTDTSTTVADLGAFAVGSFLDTPKLFWSTSSHDTLDPTYTGQYRCITDLGVSAQTYQLNVVVPPTILSFNTSDYVDNSNTVHPISCIGQGYPEPTVKLMVNSVVLTGTATNNCTAGVCTKTRTASLDGSTYTPGQSINITCTVDINQPPFTCTIAQVSAVQAECNATAKTTSHTRTIPVGAPCPLFDPSHVYDFNATFSNVSGTVLGISCRAGFTKDTSTSSIDTITCQDNGMWTTLPTCTDIDECSPSPCPANATCQNLENRFDCGCLPGYSYNRDTNECQNINECLTLCKDKSTSCTDTVGSYKCECQTGFNGTAPSCTDIDECNTMCNGTSSQCNNTLGSFLCTCDPGFTGDGFNCTDTSTLEERTLAPDLNQSATSTLAPAFNQSATSMLNQSATSTLAPDLNQSTTSTLAPDLNQSATSTLAPLSDGGADPTSSVPDIGETPAQSDSVMSTGSTTTFNSTLDIPNGKSSLTGGQVAGLVIGTLLLVALIGGIVFTLVKKQSPGSGKHISMTEMNA
ncbi:neurogenic locus notch homolog protein 1-like [Sycon ciliatum]|uniref:neurogenic locus notch homolog protein 1-like n=1 Tax=Sycon ciliatum TaxID=27933 RepID=UPI0031F6044E